MEKRGACSRELQRLPAAVTQHTMTVLKTKFTGIDKGLRFNFSGSACFRILLNYVRGMSS